MGPIKNEGEGGIEESKYIPYRIHGTMCISLPTNSSHENDHHSWIGKYTIHPYRNGRFSSAKNRCRTFGVGVRQKWFENFGVFSGCFRGVEKILRRLVGTRWGGPLLTRYECSYVFGPYINGQRYKTGWFHPGFCGVMGPYLKLVGFWAHLVGWICFCCFFSMPKKISQRSQV